MLLGVELNVKFVVPARNGAGYTILEKRLDVERELSKTPTLRMKYFLNELASNEYLSPIQFHVKDVFFADKVCYVDLSSSSIKNVNSILDEVDMVNSIVKTVFVNLDNVKEVIILVDDKPAKVLVRFYDISMPFYSPGEGS